MKVRNVGKREDTTELQMTSMIDIVFQLLVFFIMTFKVVIPEGDFNIRMPLSAPSEGPPNEDELPPMKVRLRAQGNGELASIRFNDIAMGGFNELQNHIIGILGPERGPGSRAAAAEVELDCDYGLKYENVIQAITSVSGFRDEGGQTVKLVEKIKFAPPKQP